MNVTSKSPDNVSTSEYASPLPATGSSSNVDEKSTKDLFDIKITNVFIKMYSNIIKIFNDFSSDKNIQEICYFISPVMVPLRHTTYFLNVLSTGTKVLQLVEEGKPFTKDSETGKRNFLNITGFVVGIFSDVIGHMKAAADIGLSSKKWLKRNFVDITAYGKQYGCNLNKLHTGLGITSGMLGVVGFIQHVWKERDAHLGEALKLGADVTRIGATALGQSSLIHLKFISLVLSLVSSSFTIAHHYVKKAKKDKESIKQSINVGVNHCKSMFRDHTASKAC